MGGRRRWGRVHVEAEKDCNAACRCEGRGVEGGGILEGFVIGVALGSK
jgi:hypothetical protein